MPSAVEMALPAPAAPVLAAAAGGALNPVEVLLNSFNTNPYFIGIMMLILNLGGRHLATGLTPEQDKVFQIPWVRRALLFVVIFVATRNIFTAFWLTLGIVLVIGYLTNETSALYLFGPPRRTAPPATPMPPGLTADEQEIYKRLHEKAQKAKPEPAPAEETTQDLKESLYRSYMNRMQQITTTTMMAQGAA
jgi:hypothetical protein